MSNPPPPTGFNAEYTECPCVVGSLAANLLCVSYVLLLLFCAYVHISMGQNKGKGPPLKHTAQYCTYIIFAIGILRVGFGLMPRPDKGPQHPMILYLGCVLLPISLQLLLFVCVLTRLIGVQISLMSPSNAVMLRKRVRYLGAVAFVLFLLGQLIVLFIVQGMKQVELWTVSVSPEKEPITLRLLVSFPSHRSLAAIAVIPAFPGSHDLLAFVTEELDFVILQMRGSMRSAVIATVGQGNLAHVLSDASGGIVSAPRSDKILLSTETTPWAKNSRLVAISFLASSWRGGLPLVVLKLCVPQKYIGVPNISLNIQPCILNTDMALSIPSALESAPQTELEANLSSAGLSPSRIEAMEWAEVGRHPFRSRPNACPLLLLSVVVLNDNIAVCAEFEMEPYVGECEPGVMPALVSSPPQHMDVLGPIMLSGPKGCRLRRGPWLLSCLPDAALVIPITGPAPAFPAVDALSFGALFVGRNVAHLVRGTGVVCTIVPPLALDMDSTRLPSLTHCSSTSVPVSWCE
ncbi:hypothetical protein KIPB_006590, partial [Kipferlia bialata]|eukprot:g6590.t1